MKVIKRFFTRSLFMICRKNAIYLRDLQQNENLLNIYSKGKAKSLILSFIYQFVLVCHYSGPACDSQDQETWPLMSLFLAMPNSTSLLCPMM